MKNFAVVDVETTELVPGKIPKTKFWGYADATGYRKFKTSGDLVKFLRGIEPKVLLHHTNFDVLQLLIDGVAVSIRSSHRGKLIRCGLGKHTLQNSYCAFPMGLGKIFKAFGYEKTALSNLAKRNYEDCVNGLDCFLKLDSLVEKLCGVSPLQMGTIAGTTFRAAENLAGRMPVDQRFPEAYRGGRVEAFDLRQQQAYCFDIHSSYPASIQVCPKSDYLYRLRVSSTDWHGAFFDEAVSDMLLFPSGSFNSWAYQSNIDSYLLSSRKVSLDILHKVKIDFSWLVEIKELLAKIYEQKRTAKDPAIETACKLLLNAFYGRIGLRGSSERASIEPSPLDGDDTIAYKIGRNRWLCFRDVERQTRSNFSFAAWITDNARARLYQAFRKANAIYGDTDSVFTRCSQSKFPFQQTDACGAWGYNGRGTFRANNVKDYVWGKKIVRKGGSKFIRWTLKDFASGRTVSLVTRKRRTELRKRIVNQNGSTDPLKVSH